MPSEPAGDQPPWVPRRAGPWLAMGAFLLGYLALQEPAFALLLPPSYIPLLWPPAGLATAALLLVPRRRWLPYLLLTGLASLAGNLYHGQPATAAWLYAGYNMLVALAGAYAFQVFGGREARLETMTDLRNLVVGPCLLAPMATSVVGVAALIWAGVLPAEGFLLEWEHHWVGQALGVLAIVPVALTWPRSQLSEISDRLDADALRAAAWLAVITLGAWWSLGSSGMAAGTGLILELAPFLLLYWVAARFGLFPAAAGAALATAVVLGHYIAPAGLSVPGSLTSDQGLRLFRAVLVALILPTLGLAVTVRERTKAQEEVAKVRKREVERLSKLDAMRRDFVNRASHELKTPLTPLRFQTRALASGFVGELDERQAQAVEILDRNTRRMAHLVDDLMRATKIQSDGLDLDKAQVDLRSVARSTVETYRAQATAEEIQLELEAPAQGPWILGDADRLGQVLSNVLDNALRFTPSGGRVEVELRAEDGQALLEVSDTGPGLTEEEASDAFEPFVQPIQAPPGAKPGTGLGLHISRGIVEAHGGRLTCTRPGKGQGAVFTASFPLSRAAAG